MYVATHAHMNVQVKKANTRLDSLLDGGGREQVGRGRGDGGAVQGGEAHPPLSVSCSRPSSGFHDLGGVEASTAEEGGVLTLRTLRNATSIEVENGNGSGRVSGIESGGGRGETRVRNGRVERNKTELEERLCAVTASFASPLAAAR